MSFQDEWKKLVGIEGGFVDDPSDSGGATKWGVTERVARAHGYTGSMRNLPLDTAMDIAKLEYWDKMRLDEINQMSPAIAAEMFDTGYNAGHSRASRFLQRSLNVLNRKGRDYDDQVVDGKIGRRSLAALKQYLITRPKHGERVLENMLNCLQGAFYVELAERREKDERFVYGWYKERVNVR